MSQQSSLYTNKPKIYHLFHLRAWIELVYTYDHSTDTRKECKLHTEKPFSELNQRYEFIPNADKRSWLNQEENAIQLCKLDVASTNKNILTTQVKPQMISTAKVCFISKDFSQSWTLYEHSFTRTPSYISVPFFWKGRIRFLRLWGA